MRLDGTVIDDPEATVTLTGPLVMQKGRNTFVRVLIDDEAGAL